MRAQQVDAKVCFIMAWRIGQLTTQPKLQFRRNSRFALVGSVRLVTLLLSSVPELFLNSTKHGQKQKQQQRHDFSFNLLTLIYALR